MVQTIKARRSLQSVKTAESRSETGKSSAPKVAETVARVKRTTPRAIELAEDAPSDRRTPADPLGLPFVQPQSAHLAHRSAFLPRRDPSFLPRGDASMQMLVYSLLGLVIVIALGVLWAVR